MSFLLKWASVNFDIRLKGGTPKGLLMEYLSPNEVVILNPILYSRPVQVALNANKPVYAAATNGIYLVKKGQYMVNEGYKALLPGFIVVFSFLFLFAGLAALTDPIGRPFGVFFLIVAVAGLAAAWKLWKSAKEGLNRKTLPVELVLPWNQVRGITVMNVRDINTGTLLNPVFKEVGDWHVFTLNGYELVIPEVDDPYNKLEYVKNRFGLRF